MIVGGYTIHLYCDDPRHDAEYILSLGRAEYLDATFNGNTYNDCARQARKKGWILSHNRQSCICPNHSGKNPEKKRLVLID